MFSKNFLLTYFTTILILGVLANFSFKLYISLFNPDLPKNEVALAEALKSWQMGMSYFNIIILASMVALGFMYIFKRRGIEVKKD